MTKVSLRKETGSMIHFSHPYWIGIVFLCLAGSFFLLSFSHLHEPVVLETKILAAFFAIVGVLVSIYRLDLLFLPNNRSYRISKGIWPFVRKTEGHYEELIGVVLSKKAVPTVSRRLEGESFIWTASFAFTSTKKPIDFFASRSEKETRYQFERFAKHFQTKAFDRSDAEKIVETNWNQLTHILEEQSLVTQNILDINLDNPPEGIHMEHGRKGFRLELPIQGVRMRFIFVVFVGLSLIALSAWTFAFFASQTDTNEIGLYLSLSIFVGGLLAFLTGMVGYLGKQRVMFYEGKVYSDFLFFSIPFFEKTISSDDIEEIKVRENTSERWVMIKQRWQRRKPKEELQISYELIIRSDFQRILFGRNNDKEILEWIRGALIGKIFDQDIAS